MSEEVSTRATRPSSASELPRRIANVVVQAVMSSPAGLRVDRGRFLQVVEDRLPDLFTGTRLRFDPIVSALLRIEGVSARDLYLGVVNLSIQLAQMGIELEPPDLDLDHATRLQLLAEAQAGAERARREARELDLRRRIHRLRRRKLGNLLVEEGLISGAQLAEALEAQKRLGGRLGTNLVEQGHLSEVELAHFLSLQLGVPSVTRLDQIGPDARGVLPRALAELHRVVPTRVDVQEVHLAMADPLDLEAIDDVAEATGRRVFPVVAPELLISYALERSYGVPRTPRVLSAPRPVRVGGPKDEDVVHEPLGGPDAGETTLDFPALGASLTAVETEVQVFDLVQTFLAQRFTTSAVFVVEGDRIRGWSHRGALTTQARFRQSGFVYANHPVLAEVAGGVIPYVGPGSARTGSRWLTEVLGLVPEAQVVGLPFRRDGDPAAIAVAHLDDGRSPKVGEPFIRMVEAALQIIALRHRILDCVA